MNTLISIRTYPVKSCGGIEHRRLGLEPRGLHGDRRWLIVDTAGRFITGRTAPSLVQVTVEEHDDGIVLSAPNRAPLFVAAPTAVSQPGQITIWRHSAPARHTSRDADAWFSDVIGRDCRLVYQHTEDVRSIAGEPGGQSGDHVSFADGYPLLLIGTASLAELNRRLDFVAQMERFRTNLVIDTDEPFVEDSWQNIMIGDCRFDVARRCARCVFTTVDPVSGEKHPQGEPLKTLRGFRLDKAERGVMFGVNLIPRALGDLAVGQEIRPS